MTHVTSLRRYPVKSMAGEELETTNTTTRGLCGDRAYALVDTENGKVGSAKSVRRFGNLLKWHARLMAEPQSDDAVPPVRITSPDGGSFASDDAESVARLAALFGPHVALRSSPPAGLLLEFAAGTLAGKHAETTEAPLPPGTFFDGAAVHLLTTSTLKRLDEAQPGAPVSVDRFRPNIVVDGAGAAGFVENDWVGRSLQIGPDVVMRVLMPCPRCVMPTLPRSDLPADPGLLRTLAKLNMQDMGDDFGRLPCAGVYAEILTPGRISRGDEVRLVD